MSTFQIVALLLIGVGLLVVSILLRVYSQGKYEIKTIDVVFIIVPLLLAGLVTGKVRGFDLFGVKADFSDLWVTAANTKVGDFVSRGHLSQVDDVIEMMRPAPKMAVAQIPILIEERTQALAFTLGRGFYHGPAIEKYFDALYGSSYLKYVVINHADDRLFGIYDAADLIAFLRTAGDNAGYERIEQAVNQPDELAKEWLANLRGFVSSDDAVTRKTSKRDALQAMEELGVDSLPVIDDDGQFIGTVERSKLTASLILAVSQKLSDKE